MKKFRPTVCALVGATTILVGNTESAVANTIPLKKIVAAGKLAVAPKATPQLNAKSLARNQAKQAITKSNYTVFSGFNSFHRPVTLRAPGTINYLPPTIIGNPISTVTLPSTVSNASTVPDAAPTAALLGGTLGALLLWSRKLKPLPVTPLRS